MPTKLTKRASQPRGRTRKRFLEGRSTGKAISTRRRPASRRFR